MKTVFLLTLTLSSFINCFSQTSKDCCGNKNEQSGLRTFDGLADYLNKKSQVKEKPKKKKKLSLSEILDSWRGQTKASLIQAWGIPDMVSTDANGDEILVYESRWSSTVNNYTNNYYCRKMMFVNSGNIIYCWRYKGWCKLFGWGPQDEGCKN
ncbi:MAG: hypothetical protein NTY88_00900 [Bacteroidetes bacterium]|nr:hypothetical protein [Bacteroidota bacterium]